MSKSISRFSSKSKDDDGDLTSRVVVVFLILFISEKVCENHATLAGHSFAHEVATANAFGIMGSIDINCGNAQNGWDTDQFATDYYLTTQIMLVLLKYGLSPGGVNFDAKVRRESFEPVDLFHAHIGSMDAFAKGLRVAAAIEADNALSDPLTARYSSWDGELGKKIEAGETSLTELEAIMLEKGEAAANQSGRHSGASSLRKL